jgi:hypothetical protein
MTDEAFTMLSNAEQDHAFRVASVAQADLVNDVFSALDSALVEGDFAVFKKRVGKQLADAWGGADALRLDTVFDTNVQSAFSAGRYRQMVDPAILRARPIWRMRVVEDGRTSKYCKPVDHVTEGAESAYWDHNYPMRHYRCRSYVETLSPETPVDASPPTTPPAPGFGGRPPSVGTDWRPDLSSYPEAIAAELAKRI